MGRLGKAHARTLVALCGLSAATIGVAQNTPGVFYDAVSSDLGMLRGTFALHAMAQQLGLAAGSMAAPRLLRRASMRRLTLACTVALVATTLAMAAASDAWVFCVLGALRGIGAATCANVPIAVVINGWFRRGNGTLTSMVLAFSGVAGALCSPLLMCVIQSVGWRTGYLAQAALLVVCMAPALGVPLALDPSGQGVEPLGDESHEVTRGGMHEGAYLPARSPWVAVLCLFALLHSTVTGLAQHIAGYAASAGFAPGFGASLLSLCLVGNCMAKLAVGPLADKTGAVRASVAMVVANVCGLLLILVGASKESAWQMATGCVLYGSVYAVGAVGIALLTRHFFGAEQYARTFSRVGAAGFLGCAVGLPIAGYAYDLLGTYGWAVAGCLALHAIDLVLLALLFMRLRRGRRMVGASAPTVSYS